MTFLTREVGMICWITMRSLRPSTLAIVARTFSTFTPSLFSTCVASVSEVSRASSRCSVPM